MITDYSRRYKSEDSVIDKGSLQIKNKSLKPLFITALIFFFFDIGFLLRISSYEKENIIFTIIFTVITAILFFTAFQRYRKSKVPLCNISETNPQKAHTILESPVYLAEVLPNGITIGEQQQLDYKMADGQFSTDTPTYLGMRIVSSTIPPSPNYAQLNDDEKKFFSTLHEKLIEAGYKPEFIKLTRLSDGTFNVDYIGLCYIGKICLYKNPATYAVVKKGNKKATRIFSELPQAKEFAAKNSMYEIQIRPSCTNAYMQYTIGLKNTKHMHNPSLQQCISSIPKWIRYLNYCKRN